MDHGDGDGDGDGDGLGDGADVGNGEPLVGTLTRPLKFCLRNVEMVLLPDFGRVWPLQKLPWMSKSSNSRVNL